MPKPSLNELLKSSLKDHENRQIVKAKNDNLKANLTRLFTFEDYARYLTLEQQTLWVNCKQILDNINNNNTSEAWSLYQSFNKSNSQKKSEDQLSTLLDFLIAQLDQTFLPAFYHYDRACTVQLFHKPNEVFIEHHNAFIMRSPSMFPAASPSILASATQPMHDYTRALLILGGLTLLVLGVTAVAVFATYLLPLLAIAGKFALQSGLIGAALVGCGLSASGVFAVAKGMQLGRENCAPALSH